MGAWAGGDDQGLRNRKVQTRASNEGRWYARFPGLQVGSLFSRASFSDGVWRTLYTDFGALFAQYTVEMIS